MPEDYECVDGIEVLSTLCDERGLEHWDSEVTACETHIFIDKAGNPHECWEAPDGMVNVVISMSPEQAVELGSGTCYPVPICGFDGEFTEYDCDTCSACGAEWDGDTPNFCPNCGAKVVDE